MPKEPINVHKLMKTFLPLLKGTGCPGGYAQETNTRYFGASSNSATTETACRTACDGSSSCLGYGFNRASGITQR